MASDTVVYLACWAGTSEVFRGVICCDTGSGPYQFRHMYHFHILVPVRAVLGRVTLQEEAITLQAGKC